MSTVILGILVVSLAVLIAVAGLFLVRRLTSLNLREEHNAVAGFIYSGLAVAYAVVLGFVLITVWGRYEAASEKVDQEGAALAAIYWTVDPLPDSDRRQVRQLARSYAQVVIDEEWPMMQDGKSSPYAWALMDQLRQSMQHFEPSTPAEQVLYDHGLARVHELSDARRLRLFEANTHIPTILWVILVSGGVIMVGFPYLFGLKNTWVHTVMVVLLTVIVASILFAIYTLEHRFSADTQLTPEALELDLQQFEESP
jgi:protein-S-isoprenylcysteine O-methyltransferase Ste14